MGLRENLESLLAKGQESALTRMTLGDLCLKAGDGEQALAHLARSVELDPQFSAAWKSYGKALAAAGRTKEAAAAYQRGIAVAQLRGDRQAVKEMQVFLKRLQR